MERAMPTEDEQELAYRIALRIDGAEYRQKISNHSRKIRTEGLKNIILDEVMQFNRQEPKMEVQTEIEW